MRSDDPNLEAYILERTTTPRPDCIIWSGATDRGYGRIYVDGTAARVHRVMWERKNGPIPEGLTIDHLCRVKACCNTEHMELVTGAENSRRAAVSRAQQKLSRIRPNRSQLAVRVITNLDAAMLVMDRYVEPLGDHWVWVGYVNNHGYGVLEVSGRRWTAHRLLWEINNGPLDRRTRIVRACETPLCCNPDHYALSVPLSKRTHCMKGHELTPDNLYEYPQHNIRACRTCALEAARERHRRNRDQQTSAA